ncbi:hypothetical protein MNV49_002275 [Pseudohyphozyma bogoriensis]|nr:hypothetical protein MNV49_002275 [Pseudohyphozyma bogoriensis]
MSPPLSAIPLTQVASITLDDTKSRTDSDNEAEKGHAAPHGATVSDHQMGVGRIEGLYLVFGKGWKIYMLYASIGLICYCYSLESNTTYNYLAFATSSFGQHSLLGTISTVTSIIGSVGRPFIARIADLLSRPHAYLFSLTFYVLGLILIASSQTVSAVGAGQVLYTVGSTGLDLTTTIIIGDITDLQYRGLAQGIAASPYIVNAFIAGFIADDFGVGNWRWGYGLFCIVLPVAMAPALSILFWADRKSQKLGALSLSSPTYARRELAAKQAPRPWYQVAANFFTLIDGVGLILLGLSFSLILVPLTLVASADGGWHNASIIAMIVVGGVLLISLFVWEFKFARYPLMPKRICNRTFICCVGIDFLYYCSGYIQSLYYSSWVYVVKAEWSYRNYVFFLNTLGVGLCTFGLLVGLCHRVTHRFKAWQLMGVCIRVIGMALVYYGTGDNASDAVLIMSQVLISLGGAYSVIGTQVGSQASVPHADLATAISLLSLWTNLGGSIGLAISTAIWTNKMPVALTNRLGSILSADEIAEIYGSITVARDGTDAVRAGTLLAYNDVAKNNLYLPALILAIVPIAFAACTENFYLGNQQNAIEDKKIVIKSEIDEDALVREAKAAEERELAKALKEKA